MLDRVSRSSLMKEWWATRSPSQRHAHAMKIVASRTANRAAQNGARTRRRRGHLGTKPLIACDSPLGERIERLYLDGYSGPVIANKVRDTLGSPVAPGTVYRVLRERGVERRTAGWPSADESTNGTAPHPTSHDWIETELARLETERNRLNEGIAMLQKYRDTYAAA